MKPKTANPAPLPAECYQDIVDSVMQHTRKVTVGHARTHREVTAALDRIQVELQMLRLEYTQH